MEQSQSLPKASEKTNSPVTNDCINQLYKSREEALAVHDLAWMKMTERTTNRTKPFKVNDQVWLESKNLKIPYQSRKLTPKWEGPFKIKEVLGLVTYRLTLPRQWKIHDVFHACLLMPYKETDLHGNNETRPPPDLVEGNEEYKVEAILSHCCNGRIPFRLGSISKVPCRSPATCPPCSALQRGTPSSEFRVWQCAQPPSHLVRTTWAPRGP